MALLDHNLLLFIIMLSREGLCHSDKILNKNNIIPMNYFILLKFWQHCCFSNSKTCNYQYMFNSMVQTPFLDVLSFVRKLVFQQCFEDWNQLYLFFVKKIFYSRQMFWVTFAYYLFVHLEWTGGRLSDRCLQCSVGIVFLAPSMHSQPFQTSLCIQGEFCIHILNV